MEIATLPKAVEGFFDTLLPPFLQAVLLIAFIIFFFGASALTTRLKLYASSFRAPASLAEDAFIKESGVLKLIPIALLVAILLTIISLDRAISFVGFKIPGQLSFSEPNVLIDSVPTDQLAKLWALYPAAADEHMLYLVLEQQAASAAASAPSNSKLPWNYHDEMFSDAARTLNVLKFYLLLGLIFCLARNRLGLGARNVWARYAAVLVMGLAIGGFLVTQQINAKRQSDWAKLNYVIARQVVAGSEAESRLRDADVRLKYEEELRKFKESERSRPLGVFYPRF